MPLIILKFQHLSVSLTIPVFFKAKKGELTAFFVAYLTMFSVQILQIVLIINIGRIHTRDIKSDTLWLARFFFSLCSLPRLDHDNYKNLQHDHHFSQVIVSIIALSEVVGRGCQSGKEIAKYIPILGKGNSHSLSIIH